MRIGKVIKELRLERHLSQKEIAVHLGITAQQISKWESDNTRPEYENLIALAELFDVTVDYILGKEK